MLLPTELDLNHQGEESYDGKWWGLLRNQTEVIILVKNRRSSREVQLLSRLKHENIVPLLHSCKQGRQYAIVLPVLEHTLGFYNIITDKPREAMRYAFDALRGLAFLHANRVLHGDIKPQHIMFCRSDNKWKLIDFDSAVQFPKQGDCIATGLRGTSGWRAPEVAQQEGGEGYSFPADIYSLGLTMNWHFGGAMHGQDWQVLHSLIRHCLARRPYHRPTAEEALNMLRKYL